MFRKKTCEVCQEKEKQIEFLKEQNKDLYDRLMSFNRDAFVNYQAEKKEGPDLYPYGMDKDGNRFSYEDTNPEEAKSDVFRAMGEDPITVDEKK